MHIAIKQIRIGFAIIIINNSNEYTYIVRNNILRFVTVWLRVCEINTQVTV